MKINADDEFETAIIDYLEMMQDVAPGVDTYLADGEFRSVEPLTDDETEEGNALITQLDLAMKQCWYNSQLVATSHPDFTYVEGYTISERAPVPIHHAWVEKHGKVWELTMRGSPHPPDGAVYYGVAIADERITEQLDETGTADPIIGDGSLF